MSISLRAILFISSLVASIYIVLKLRNSKVQLMDALFWLVVSSILFLFGAIPSIPIQASSVLGIASPANFVFLIMLFIVLFRCFLLSIRLSELESRYKVLVEEIGIRNITDDQL